MSENTKLWDLLGRTDPAHTQQFKRGGGFKGTAIKPIWSFRRMTEEFGPCGIGWGVNEPSFQVVPGYNSEVLVYCTASIWYRHGDQEARTVYGVGGDKIISHIKANDYRPERWENDDEAFKKAFTDAVTNALKLLGVGADVHMGLFDDNKYVNAMKAEFAEEGHGLKDTHNGSGDVVQMPAKSSAQLKRDVDWREVEREIWECKTILALDKMRQILRDRAVKEGWNQSFKYAAKELLDKQEQDIRDWAEASAKVSDLPESAQNYMAG